MKSYIKKPNSIKKNDLISLKSLSPYSFRKIKCVNSNTKILKSFLVENKKGNEFGSDSYIKFSDNYFIRIGDMSDIDFTIAETKKTLKVKIPLTSKGTLKKGDICYQTASNVGNVCFYNGKGAFYNSHIRKLSFKENKFYIFSMLKSSFCRNQVDIGGSIKGVDNFSENYLLNTIIPFPTKKQNEDPKNIEVLVSIITQNIIDKEEQIKFKIQAIDKEISKELQNNQKPKQFIYKYPRLSDLKRENRLDSGLYTKEYKMNNFLIKNYNNGCFNINVEEFKSGSTPKIRIFNGKKYDYKWVTPTNIQDDGFYQPIEKISMPTPFNLTKDAVLLINRTSKGKKGEYVGIACFYDYQYYGKGHHNQGLYRVENFSKNKKLFIVAFMICGNISIGSKMKEMKSYDFEKIVIPNFTETKQKKIIKYYYNQVKHPRSITLKNYFTENKKRNKELGVHQLNIEIFNLKNKLEDLIDKIIMDEKIIIDDYLYPSAKG